MINVVTVSTQKTTLNFSTANECSAIEVTRIYINDKLLFSNAAELLAVQGDSFGLDICEICGIAACTPAGITIRKSNNSIIFLPAFSLATQDPLIMDSIRHSTKNIGICFLEDKYQALCQIIPTLPAPQQIPPLSHYEALCLFQAEAPYSVMGKFPDQAILQKKRYLCAEEDKLPELLDKNIKRLSDAPASTALLKQIDQEALSIYLDTADLKQWRLMYKVKNSYHLRLKPNFYIV